MDNEVTSDRSREMGIIFPEKNDANSLEFFQDKSKVIPIYSVVTYLTLYD
jgi:hypothetical protein